MEQEAAGDNWPVSDHAVYHWLSWLGPRAGSLTWQADGKGPSAKQVTRKPALSISQLKYAEGEVDLAQ